MTGCGKLLPIEVLTQQMPLPGLFMRFIGVAAVLGAVRLILPGLLRIRPGLTPLAATELVIIMIGATVLTLAGGGVALALIPLVVGLLSAFVAYGRWRLAPHRGSSHPSGLQRASKTQTVPGLVRARGGEVRLGGRRWANGDPSENVRRGLVLVPQGRGVFPDLTVAENLLLGGHNGVDAAAARERTREVFDLFPVLAERRAQKAGTLSGGQQQMVAVGIALMQRPRLMMLDEPSIGLAPVLVQRVLGTVREINRRFGTAIVLVEQNIKSALTMASRAYVMKSGRIVLEKRAAELMAAEDSWWELY